MESDPTNTTTMNPAASGTGANVHARMALGARLPRGLTCSQPA